VPRIAGADPATSPFPTFDFFSGETEGNGVLHIALHAPRPIHVVGQGQVDPDGVLILDQKVETQGRRAQHRQWRIREVAPGRYAGTLSDASGAVNGAATPGMLRVAFRMSAGLEAVQTLRLAPDGRSAHNIMVVKKLGITVGVLDETIRKVG
jgi:Protein of unknown function (DUF3833)